MSKLVRFSVSLEDDLMRQFDRYCREEPYATRSEAVRQLIRDTLTRRAWASEAHEAAGTLTLVYDHHRAQLRDRLMQLQHDHTDLVIATLHAHLSHDLCLEVIVLRGPVGEINRTAENIISLKGVKLGRINLLATEVA